MCYLTWESDVQIVVCEAGNSEKYEGSSAMRCEMMGVPAGGAVGLCTHPPVDAQSPHGHDASHPDA